MGAAMQSLYLIPVLETDFTFEIILYYFKLIWIDEIYMGHVCEFMKSVLFVKQMKSTDY